MDAFYASVVLRDHPELRRAPVVVAGGGDRGVVLCATYPARRSGVGAGMPTARARRLCPDLVVVRPDFAAFAEVSTAVFALFESVTPHVEPLSQEEAFLDVRGARRTATPLELASRLRERVRDEQRITCSVGIAATRPVAKLASRRAKPDGVAVIAPDCVREVLDPLDVGDLWGVGPATRARLAQIGLETVGDVRAASVDLLRSRLGDAAGRHVHALVRGVDTARASPGFVRRERPRSIGADRTLGRDLGERDVVLAEVLRLTVEVTSRLRRAGLAARTVGLRLRYPDFTTVSRSRTLVEPTTTTREVYEAVVALHDAERGRSRHARPVRLLGVRVTELVDAGQGEQLRLGEPEHGWGDADRAVDELRARFGRSVVAPATLLRGGERSV
ncbi:DNA polymerase IV [Nocardioides sp. ChNu-153]|nr:DNA polymerase IV [Nocardioides sp. ChNu-99]MDN7120884.1 DNA polymerase IV [Nocardioides sp. ChNu-153]